MNNKLRALAGEIFKGPTAKTYWTLSSVVFLSWFADATGGYLTVFLQQNGFEPRQVGFINAVNAALAIVALPLWGMVADKWRSTRKTFLLCMCCAAVFWGLVPGASKVFIGPFLLLYLAIPVAIFFKQPALSLIDAFLVQTSARERVPYGNVRLWGSLSYAAMSLTLSAILPLTGVQASFYMYGVAFLPTLFIMARMGRFDPPTLEQTERKKRSSRDLRIGRLFKQYYFVSYLFFAIFLTMPMVTSIAFLPYLVDMVGGNTAQLGLVIGYKALLEVPMLLLMKPLRRYFPLPLAIVLACALYVVEFICYSAASNLTHIILIQTLQGMAGGLMLGSASNYIFAMAPEGLKSTAQTVNGAMQSVSAILGNALGGILIGSVGIRQFYLTAGVIVLAAMAYFLTTLFVGTKILKKPLPFLARSEISREREALKAAESAES